MVTGCYEQNVSCQHDYGDFDLERISLVIPIKQYMWKHSGITSPKKMLYMRV